MDQIGARFDLNEPNFRSFANKLESQYNRSLKEEIEEDTQEFIQDKNPEELNKLLQKLYRIGNYREAINLAKTSVSLIENKHSTNHLYTANAYHGLGSLYQKIGEFDKALEYYKKALPILKNKLSDENQYTLNVKDAINKLSKHLKKNNN